MSRDPDILPGPGPDPTPILKPQAVRERLELGGWYETLSPEQADVVGPALSTYLRTDVHSTERLEASSQRRHDARMVRVFATPGSFWVHRNRSGAPSG